MYMYIVCVHVQYIYCVHVFGVLLKSLLFKSPYTRTHTCTQLGSPFRDPVMKFALKFPKQTVEFFLARLSETSFSSLFQFFLEQKDGAPLRDTLAASSEKIIAYTFAVQVQSTSPSLSLPLSPSLLPFPSP